MVDLKMTLEELDGENWGDPDKGATGLIRKCLSLRRKPLKDFTNDDLTRMILQKFALKYLVPIAIERLVDNPLNSGDYYKGGPIVFGIKSRSGFLERESGASRRAKSDYT